MDPGVLGAHNDIPREPRAGAADPLPWLQLSEELRESSLHLQREPAHSVLSRHQPERLRALLLLRLPLERGASSQLRGPAEPVSWPHLEPVQRGPCRRPLPEQQAP